jgi:hypothetical protein
MNLFQLDRLEAERLMYAELSSSLAASGRYLYTYSGCAPVSLDGNVFRAKFGESVTKNYLGASCLNWEP